MGSTISKRWAVAALTIAIGLLACIGGYRIVDAGAAYSPTGGCTAWGMSYITSPDEAYSKTDSVLTGSYCANTYLMAGFYVNDILQSAYTQGWGATSLQIADYFSYADEILGIHNLCSSTPPCGSEWHTTE